MVVQEFESCEQEIGFRRALVFIGTIQLSRLSVLQIVGMALRKEKNCNGTNLFLVICAARWENV